MYFKRGFSHESKENVSTKYSNQFLQLIAMVALIGLGASLIVYSQQSNTLKDKDNQIASLQSQLGTPKLVSFGLQGLQYTDNRSNANAPFLQITGYVVNVGSTKANNCTIHVTPYKTET